MIPLLKTVEGQDEQQTIVVPPEVIKAFRYFLIDEKPSGSLTINFKNGGVAGVETNTKKILK
jgi:hypothetical protein